MLLRLEPKAGHINKVYDLSDLSSTKKCTVLHLEMVVTPDTFLREQIITTLGKSLGNEVKQIHFR